MKVWSSGPVPWRTTCPFWIKAAPSASASSSALCVTHSAVVPRSRVAARTAASTADWSAASRKVVSSSSNNTCASSARAPAMATLCFCPPDRDCTCRCSNPSSPTALSAASTLRLTSSVGIGPLRPSPNATSAATVGKMIWWSGF
mmetsp:Transcript_16775/g.54858  ORF Transcript_16775/g.54858 Transcript_16775/m.54858 type:complete len:145 (-) Transcript_16775:319-753(-)